MPGLQECILCTDVNVKRKTNLYIYGFLSILKKCYEHQQKKQNKTKKQTNEKTVIHSSKSLTQNLFISQRYIFLFPPYSDCRHDVRKEKENLSLYLRELSRNVSSIISPNSS